MHSDTFKYISVMSVHVLAIVCAHTHNIKSFTLSDLSLSLTLSGVHVVPHVVGTCQRPHLHCHYTINHSPLTHSSQWHHHTRAHALVQLFNPFLTLMSTIKRKMAFLQDKRVSNSIDTIVSMVISHESILLFCFAYCY